MTPKELRSFRVDADLWTAALETAQSRGETVTAVLTRALTRYTRPRTKK